MHVDSCIAHGQTQHPLSHAYGKHMHNVHNMYDVHVHNVQCVCVVPVILCQAILM